MLLDPARFFITSSLGSTPLLQEQNSGTILVDLLTRIVLDCLIKAGAWAQSLGSRSVKRGPALPRVPGGPWCSLALFTEYSRWQRLRQYSGSPHSGSMVGCTSWIPYIWVIGSGQYVVIESDVWHFHLECLFANASPSRYVFPFYHSYWQHSPSSAWRPRDPPANPV